jgi:hypothetical protein
MEEEKEVSDYTARHTRPAPKEDYPSLRKPERLHIGVLRERRDYLRAKLAAGDHSEGAGPFLAGEASAIEWSLEQLDRLYGTDQVDGISKDEMAVATLEHLCEDEDDDTTAHRRADAVLLSAVSPEVRAAYEAAKRCSTHWVLSS